ncbi:MAG: Orotidine 5'-phosphate decarboxylase, partial [Candidatus Moranbacteria bacterium GW2011_GWC2_45_10]
MFFKGIAKYGVHRILLKQPKGGKSHKEAGGEFLQLTLNTEEAEMASFFEMLRKRWDQELFVCVGLDSDIAEIPECVSGDSAKKRIVSFNRDIIASTADKACAYKPNFSFYEALGADGMDALYETIEAVRILAPGVPVILDAKRADIGNTNKPSATFAFDLLGADAITVHPYLGAEAMSPFLGREDNGTIVLCRTSNMGGGEFQDRLVYVEWNELGDLVSEDISTLAKVCG